MSTAKTIDYVCRRCGSEKTVHEHGSPPDSPVYCCEAEMEIKGKAKGKGRKKASGKKVPSGTPGRRCHRALREEGAIGHSGKARAGIGKKGAKPFGGFAPYMVKSNFAA